MGLGEDLDTKESPPSSGCTPPDGYGEWLKRVSHNEKDNLFLDVCGEERAAQQSNPLPVIGLR